MIKLLRQSWKREAANALGYKYLEKKVCIQSDDWGTLRMPSIKARTALAAEGVSVDDPYSRVDGLETDEDLQELLAVLRGVRGGDGEPARITLNFVVANPDFERIERCGYEQYWYVDLPRSYRLHGGGDEVLRTIGEATREGLVSPQLHGREHLNVPLWMKALRDGDPETRLAFAHRVWGHSPRYPAARRSKFLAAFDLDPATDRALGEAIARDGAALFARVFGQRARSFIAPKFTWSPDIERALGDEGVVTLQGHRNQLVPRGPELPHRRVFHRTGQRNRFGQRYLVRNASFEPALDPGTDWVTRCLSDVASALFWRTPAIISTHRLNYMGSLHPENRARGLSLLGELLRAIVKRWPEVCFVTSDQLGRWMHEAAA